MKDVKNFEHFLNEGKISELEKLADKIHTRSLEDLEDDWGMANAEELDAELEPGASNDFKCKFVR